MATSWKRHGARCDGDTLELHRDLSALASKVWRGTSRGFPAPTGSIIGEIEKTRWLRTTNADPGLCTHRTATTAHCGRSMFARTSVLPQRGHLPCAAKDLVGELIW